MTTANHHPTDELLLQYSAGTASPSHALCVATHLEFCQICRTAHRRNNAIGGKLIDELAGDDSVEVSTAMKSKVLAMLDQSKPAAEKPAVAIKSKAIPRPLKRLVPEDFDTLKWQMVSATARSCQLYKDEDGSVISLLKLKPGGRIAKHTHMGDEYTVVLTGAFSDEDGVYRAGDFLLRDSNEAHSPVATRDAECICLTVQEAPLQFTGWLFKLLNPWVRGQFQPG